MLTSLKDVLSLGSLVGKAKGRVLAWAGQGEVSLVLGRRWRNNDAAYANEAAIQLLVEYVVSNTTKHPWSVVRAEVIYGTVFHRKKFAQMQPPQIVPPGALGANVMIHLHVHPKPCSDSQTFRGKLLLTDNLNRKHSSGVLEFEATRGPQT
jgi:hypothetical protein